MNNATNILDRWIAADTRRLTAFVRVEMDAYRLYTVVPDLVRFIENLTNIYVRYNRTRLKGAWALRTANLRWPRCLMCSSQCAR